jgi:hypothetical protein
VQDYNNTLGFVIYWNSQASGAIANIHLLGISAKEDCKMDVKIGEPYY